MKTINIGMGSLNALRVFKDRTAESLDAATHRQANHLHQLSAVFYFKEA